MENDVLLLKKQVHTLSWFCTILLIALVFMAGALFFMYNEIYNLKENYEAVEQFVQMFDGLW